MVDTMDRLRGATATLSWKKPCRAATTANITLSGYQTIDGVSFDTTAEAAGLNMRVLVKNQTDTTQNGIWKAGSGTWTREKDFDGNTDFVKGTGVLVTDGATSGGKTFQVSSSDPQSVGVNPITFSVMSASDADTTPTFDSLTLYGADIPSATTINLTTATGDVVRVTGTTTITGITLGSGLQRLVEFTGALTLTNGASLVLPGAKNITTVAGDFALFRALGSTVYCAFYMSSDGYPLTTGQNTIASASTTQLGSLLEQSLTISGSATIASFGSTAPTGAVKFLSFSSTPTLTNSGTLILPGGADIVVAAGDTAIARHEGSGTWRVVNFQRAAAAATTVTPSIVSSQTIPVATTTTSENTLMSYVLAANSLTAAGHSVRITAHGITSTSTANNKRIRLYYGGNVIADTASFAFPAASAWKLSGTASLSSAGTQVAIGDAMFCVAINPPSVTASTGLAVNATLATTIKVTGLSSVGGANEVTQVGMLVELLKF